MTHESGYSSGPSPANASGSDTEDEAVMEAATASNAPLDRPEGEEAISIDLPELMELRPRVTETSTEMAKRLLTDATSTSQDNVQSFEAGNLRDVNESFEDEGIEEISRDDECCTVVSILRPMRGYC